MADIFISYASEDRSTAAALGSALETVGWSVWWDRELVVGDDYRDVIERQLDASGCVLVLWSQSAVASQWVTPEGVRAYEAGKVLPIRLDDRLLPLPLNSVQASSLSGWDGTAASAELTELNEAIARQLDPSRLLVSEGTALFRCAAIDDWGCAAGGLDGMVRVWSVIDGRLLHELAGHGDLVTSVAWSGNGQLASASVDRTARLWSLDQGVERWVLTGHSSPVDDVAFAGADVVTVSADQTVRWWSTETGQPGSGELESCGLLSCDADVRSRLVVVGRNDGGISLFADRTRTGEIAGAHDGPIYSVRLSEDAATVLSSGGDGLARLWRIETGEMVHTFRGHRGPVLSAALGTDYAVTGSTDATVRMWSLGDGLEVGRMGGLSGGVPGVDLTPSGTVVATSGAGQVRATNLSESVSTR